MTKPEHSEPLPTLVERARRFDSLADTAELMGDDAGAARFREHAAETRAAAMRLLDD